MELYVNDSRIEITIENEKTIGDILKAFEEECAKNNATTVKISIDDKQITAENFDEEIAKEFNPNTKIELSVVTLDSICEVLSKECKIISEELKQLSVQLQSGKDKEANSLIATLADLVDKICQTMALFPEKYSDMKINDKPISLFFSDFASVLNDFKNAIESKDTVLTGDLAEYEISPRLEELSKSLEG